MLFEDVFSLKKIFVLISAFICVSCTEQTLKTSYEIDTCLQETLRMLSSNHPRREMVYKVKNYQNKSYTLYLRYNDEWWYYRTIQEDELIEKDLSTIICPDFDGRMFK